MSERIWATADLCDAHPDAVQVALPGWMDLGGVRAFCGPALTMRCPEDNSLVREAVGQAGEGRVLVVDGGASSSVALLGDILGEKAVANGWSGVLVNGYVRDARLLATFELGVRALGTLPRKSEKLGRGERDVALAFGGVQVNSGDWIYADEDGWIVAPRALH